MMKVENRMAWRGRGENSFMVSLQLKELLLIGTEDRREVLKKVWNNKAPKRIAFFTCCPQCNINDDSLRKRRRAIVSWCCFYRNSQTGRILTVCYSLQVYNTVWSLAPPLLVMAWVVLRMMTRQSAWDCLKVARRKLFMYFHRLSVACIFFSGVKRACYCVLV